MHPLPKSNVLPFTNAVRFAEPADEQEVRLLLMLGHAENSIFQWDLAKSDFIIKRLLFTPWIPASDQGLRGCFGVIGPKGRQLYGLAMMAISSHWYTTQPMLEEFIVYVHPEYRSGQLGYAAALLDWMIARSEQMHIPLLTGVISLDRMDAKCRLYRRKLTPVGQFFLHLPQGSEWESQLEQKKLRYSSIRSSSAA
jgi:GNAT superfamily N-acetyltransferase